jgi:hypothetical protein
MVSKRRLAFVVLGLAILSAFAFFVPISHPTFDICPHSSLVSNPYVSLSYLMFRYGAVYFVGYGYAIWLNPDC